MKPGWHIDSTAMHLTLGEMQRHLLVCLASVLEQCPVNGSFLEGTGHCENRFDKGQGPSRGWWRRTISRGLHLSYLIPGHLLHRSLPEPLLQHWTSFHELSPPALFSQDTLHHPLPFLITFPDSFPSSLCQVKCMAMMNQWQCSASQTPFLPYPIIQRSHADLIKEQHVLRKEGRGSAPDISAPSTSLLPCKWWVPSP